VGRTVLVIANPAAGFRPVEERAALAAQRLDSLGLRAELYRTNGPGDAQRAARAAVKSFDLVVAAGGDGTVHEVANGLAQSQTPMGVVPLGSMNILARELGVPLDVDGACAWIERAQPRPIALGMRDEQYFVIMAGIGYDAFVLQGSIERAERAGRKVGFSDYVYMATLGAGAYSFPRFLVESGEFRGEGVFAIVANCARYGGNLRIANRASVDEPLLDLVLYERGSFPARFEQFLAVLAGAPAAARGVAYRKLETLTIRPLSEERVPCQLDGEPSAPLPATIRSAPAALLLLRSPQSA
jgi:YegS/Rv2252/BmrU family lipid kinase